MSKLNLIESLKKKAHKPFASFNFHRQRESGFFPFSIRIELPATKDIAQDIPSFRQQLEKLIDSIERMTSPPQILWKNTKNRLLGALRLPERLTFTTLPSYLEFINESESFAKFTELLDMAADTHPNLANYLREQPQIALKYAQDWNKILATVSFFLQNPQPGIYIRQLPIPDVDTKFIESKKSLLLTLLCVVSSDIAQRYNELEQNSAFFERCLGLKTKPQIIRMRLLDPRKSLCGFSDLSVSLSALAKHPPDCEWVIFTENLVNGLALPQAYNAIVIMGLGYRAGILANLPWLVDRKLLYWGDIDSHGFQMLIDLRKAFSHVESFLMDPETIASAKEFVGEETSSILISHSDLQLLDDQERQAYDKFNSLTCNYRLEQERVPMSYVISRLRKLDLEILY